LKNKKVDVFWDTVYNHHCGAIFTQRPVPAAAPVFPCIFRSLLF